MYCSCTTHSLHNKVFENNSNQTKKWSCNLLQLKLYRFVQYLKTKMEIVLSEFVYWKAICFFSNKCSTRALFILFSLSGFWDQRKFLLFQDIKEARHDIYHKVQMTKIEQNAICSQHLHCMHECENRCSSCEQYFFY